MTSIRDGYQQYPETVKESHIIVNMCYRQSKSEVGKHLNLHQLESHSQRIFRILLNECVKVFTTNMVNIR